MNCWRRVNEIQLRRVVHYKVNTLKKNVYFISKGPPKYNFIEIKRSKDQGFQIYLTVSMMTKVNGGQTFTNRSYITSSSLKKSDIWYTWIVQG